MKRKLPILRFVLAFFLTNVLFAGVFLFAYSVSYIDYQHTMYYGRVVVSSLAEMNELVLSKSCNPELFLSASDLLDVVGAHIFNLEERNGKLDPHVLELKKVYTQIQLEHFLIVERFNKNCNSVFNIIFFFYSNHPDKIDASETTGYILQTLKSKYPETIMTYSFDSELDYSYTRSLISLFNVSNVPVVSINRGAPIEINRMSEIEDILGLRNSTLS